MKLKTLCFACLFPWTASAVGAVVTYDYTSRLIHWDGSGDLNNGPFAIPYTYEYYISQASVGWLGSPLSVTVTGDEFAMPSFQIQLSEREYLPNALIYRGPSANLDRQYAIDLPEVTGKIEMFGGGSEITGTMGEPTLVLLTLIGGNLQSSIPNIAEYNFGQTPATLVGSLAVSPDEVSFLFPSQSGPTLTIVGLSPVNQTSNWFAYARFTVPTAVPELSPTLLLAGACGCAAAASRFRRPSRSKTTLLSVDSSRSE